LAIFRKPKVALLANVKLLNIPADDILRNVRRDQHAARWDVI